MKQKGLHVLGIDPGQSGALVLTNGEFVKVWMMPVVKEGKSTEIVFEGVFDILKGLANAQKPPVVALERAIPYAQGVKHAFSYGRGFAALEIALRLSELSTTYVEPATWTKEMHKGISSDLKPKVKSLMAVKRLFPKLLKELPTNTLGRPHDGPIDALLIAGYFLRQYSGVHYKPSRPLVKLSSQDSSGDFY